MFLDHGFRLAGYLTLGLSCSALVFAETPFLPDLPICLPPVLALLLLAWWVEGRWRLPNWGANILGFFIAAGGIAWLVRQLAETDSLLTRIPLHLALLPYMGPLLLAALLVKVFGSHNASDFWRLQGLGLMQIGLGCVLDGGPVFGSLMVAYFAAALACLVLRYRMSAAYGLAACPPSGKRLSAGWLVAFALRWTLLIAVPSLLLFLLTPRRDNGAWEPLNGLRSRSLHVQGGSEEINLNDTGKVELDDAVALQVVAVDAAGRPKLDLPVEQRWRGLVLELYENGKWRVMHRMVANARHRDQHELPDFGSRQFFLTLTVPPHESGSLVLAEPVRLGPRPTRLPVVMLSGQGHSQLFHEQAGCVLPLPINSRRELRYRQVVAPGDDLARPATDSRQLGAYIPRLVDMPSQLRPHLESWTVDLLRRLSRESRYRLPEGVRAALAESTKNFLINSDDWEAVAHVLTDYLAASGEFTYTLDLTRQDRSMDPVLDFLINVKQGHCERYATALALMLRSVGIPARVVKGFRGCESIGDGSYVVRHRHAHAWVEILLPRRSADATAVLAHGEQLYEWLELDATPPESTTTASRLSLSFFWEEVQRIGKQGWQTLIIDYNAEEQADLWDMLHSGRGLLQLLKLGLVVAAIVAVFCFGLFLRRLLRPHRRSEVRLSDTVAFYLRLIHILGRYASLRPTFGQTPREYGEAARTFLQTSPGLAALAELPIHVVDLFYRVRFGGQPLSEDEHQALDADLDRFAEALRTEPRT